MSWEADLANQAFTKLEGDQFDTWGFPRSRWFEPGFWTSRIHPEDLANVVDLCDSTILKQEDCFFECRMLRSDDSIIWFDGTISAITEDGPDGARTVGLKGSLIDVTDRKIQEQELAASQTMDAVGRLAGGVAHDFNNLLTVIKTYSDLIGYSLEPSDPGTGYVKAIRAAADRAAHLTDQLLLFSTQSLDSKSAVDLNTVVRSVESELTAFVSHPVQLFLDLDPRPAVTRCDRNSLEQAIINMVRNAHDSIDDGPGQGSTVTVRTRQVTVANDDNRPLKPGSYVQLCVKDDGCGMSADIVARAFEPFFSTKEIGEGRGIGLSVVYGLAQQHDGHASIQSEVGDGTTVQVLLPIAQSSTEPPPEGLPSHDKVVGGRERILLVEDDEDTRRAEGLILSRLGYEVLSAADPVVALALVESSTDPIQLLVTDVEMPIMYGHELVRRLRMTVPKLKVLFTSGYAAEALKEELQGDHFLPKPFALASLAGSVRSALDGPPPHL